MKHIWEHKSDNTVYTYLGKSVDFYKYNLLPLPELDGNLMVAAINLMRERGDWYKFKLYCHDAWCHDVSDTDFIMYIVGSPETFFRLMQEALDKHIIGIS